MSNLGQGLREAVGNILGADAVKELAKAGIDLNTPANGGEPGTQRTPEMDLSLATNRLGAASQVIKDRFAKKSPSGSAAAATAELPVDLVEAEQHKRDLDGSNGLKPVEGESMRKLAAKAAPDLPIIRPSAELLKFLEAGNVEEFNAQRPAGRLDLTGINLSKRNLAGIDLRYCELDQR